MYVARGAGGPIAITGAFGTSFFASASDIWMWLLIWTIVGAAIILWGQMRIWSGGRKFKREREVARKQVIH